ncbi:MAG: primosomal protein N' [Phycisphaerales bacterium]
MRSTLFQPNAPEITRFVRVVVERGIDQPLVVDDEGLTYALPDGLDVVVGQRVNVPLRSEKKKNIAAGYVVKVGGRELLAGLNEDRVREVANVDSITLSATMLDLARWMAQYYVCPLGMVLASLTPSAVKSDTGRKVVEYVRFVGLGEGVKLSKQAKLLFEEIAASSAATEPVAMKALAAQLNLKSSAPLKRLIKSGILEVTTGETVAARSFQEFEQPEANHAAGFTLTSEQQLAADSILATIDTFQVHLLHGVTGSGKTEVYLQCIEQVLKAGKSAIVLVPEISLTPQTSQRFVNRFGRGVVGVMHSGLTAAQRNKEWQRVISGEARVVVGARSAVFAPMTRLGLIVVDEEHDGSYKQDQLPRYHARDVAIKRAHGEGCPVVLGSATPSLESWANAISKEDGGFARYKLISMRLRATGAELPRVQVVDMVAERRLREQMPLAEKGRQHLLGPTLEKAIETALANGDQALLLLNRRGFAHHLACPSASCGFVVGCEHCSTTLVLHRDERAPAGAIVRCHHCLTEQRVPQLCPMCRRKLTSIGGGTQRLEQELEHKFASMGIRAQEHDGGGGGMIRLDSDTMKNARDYFDALTRFARGEAKIMLGTQMIAKGLDFPGVRLVGIVDADTALNIPDFRAGERTFQLITQAAGRAGRKGGEKNGSSVVIVQTLSPDNPTILHASQHDYVNFAREELAERIKYSFPPALRMARIVCRDQDEKKALARANELAEALQAQTQVVAGTTVVGPMPCAIARIANQWRFAIEATAKDSVSLLRLLGALRASGLLRSDAKTAVDVDPVSLM